MKTVFLFLLHFSVGSALYGQYTIPQDLLNKTLLLDLGIGGTGTGFLYLDTTGTFLITAKHVILDETKEKDGKVSRKLKSNFAEITSYPQDYDKSNPNILNLNLKGLLESGNLQFSESRDIVVIKIGIRITSPFEGTRYNNFVSKKIEKTSTINGFSQAEVSYIDSVLIGNDIFILGYPKSLGLKDSPQYNFNRPLLRKGTLAGRDLILKNIIIDCPAYPGNSGGPVLMISGNVFESRIELIGIVTQFIPLLKVFENKEIGITNIDLANSGYSVVEPMDEIIKIIKKIK